MKQLEIKNNENDNLRAENAKFTSELNELESMEEAQAQ